MRFLTAGESHGPQLTAIIEGVPSGFNISIAKINDKLKKRQAGYGRGNRMKIESDKVQILSGVRDGKTTGAPITLVIENTDYANWKDIMNVEEVTNQTKRVSKPRPGHADLNGGIKYNLKDIRDVLERSSARETAIRVAVGELCSQLLDHFSINIFSHVINIGGIQSKSYQQLQLEEFMIAEFITCVEASDVRCFDSDISLLMKQEIDQAKRTGDSLGGIVEVIALGLPIGLGSHVHWDRKLDGKIGQAILSIQGFKGVEIGIGFGAANLPGSKVHDEILWSKEKGFYRSTNNAGGLEGGMTNGEPLIVKGAMKPIPTLYKPLNSVDIDTKEPFEATIERSDTCAVPAASIVAESVVAFEITKAFFEKFAGDSYDEIAANYRSYLKQVEEY